MLILHKLTCCCPPADDDDTATELLFVPAAAIIDVATGMTPCSPVPRFVTTANDDPELVPIVGPPLLLELLCTEYGTPEMRLFND